MECPYCQADNRNDSEFCGECGKPIQTGLVCLNCNYSNPSDNLFCDKCGHSLTEQTTTPDKGKSIPVESVSSVNDRSQTKLNQGIRNPEIIPNRSFRIMAFSMRIHDFICPYIEKRIRQFGIEKGMIVVDYGCGPGRYTTKFSDFVGNTGKVYALDIHKLAINTVKRKIKKYNLKNIEPILIDGYDSTLPDGIADVVCAIDMFPGVKKPTDLLKEIKRIIKKDGILIIDGWHETRDHQLPSSVVQKILDSDIWEIIEKAYDYLKCKPR